MASIRAEQQDLQKILRDIEERLQALETAQRAGFTSIGDGGALVILNAAGTPVARLGTLSVGGNGIEVDPGTGFHKVT